MSKGTSAHAGHYATRIIKPLFSWMYFFSLNDIDLLKKINMLYTLVLLLWLSIDRHHHHHYYYSKNNIRIDVMWPCDFKPLNVVILHYNISFNLKVIKRNFIKSANSRRRLMSKTLCFNFYLRSPCITNLKKQLHGLQWQINSKIAHLSGKYPAFALMTAGIGPNETPWPWVQEKAARGDEGRKEGIIQLL